MSIASGVFKQLVAKKQSALGTKATAPSAQLLRRVTSTIDLSKAQYQSKEISPSMQRIDHRHGLRSVAGTINGELSCGTYQGFVESVLRAPFLSVVTTNAQTDVTAAATTGATGTFTRAAGSYITDGFKIGMMVRWSGWATTGTANNSHNFLITNLTDLIMTVVALDGVAIGAKVSGDTVTCVSAGKMCSIPPTGHNRDYWTIEHVFTDIAQAEQFTDCAIGAMNIKLPSTGMATVDFPVIGLGMDPSTQAYFTAPTAASSSNNLAAVNGKVYVGGTAVGLITSMDIAVNGNVTSVGAVVGSNVAPDLSFGSIDVTGTVVVLFQDATMRDMFLNETETSIVACFTDSNLATAEFISIIMPVVKFGGANKDDGEKGLMMTMPFTAVQNTGGGAAVATTNTTISIQDSLAA